MTDLAVQYAEVGRVAREWDECHLYLDGAASAVDGTPLGGLTESVHAAAAVFCARWVLHLRGLGQESEVRADGLRDVVRAYLAADDTSFLDAVRVRGLLEEVR